MPTIRTFIAIELPSEAKNELAGITAGFKKSGADVKWVRPETVHLTLKFLGSVPEEKLSSISEKINEVAKSISSFDLTLGEVGVFPDWKRPRVVWVGIDGAKGVLEGIAGRIEDAMASLGFGKETRGFKSHLTLGRVRSPKNKEELEKIARDIEIKPVPVPVFDIILFKSELTREGAIHTPLEKFNLKSK
ncbi:MAG: RNA 2',3'-cyclic phosphodiesterase [Candidatus Tantalella remota]|nr:RNA 2',3'-cyclic phosphodiesterase [Candidatus Tantalella remota]